MNKKILRNILINVLYQILAILTPLILMPYLTRTLGSKGVGEYAYHYAIASYFGLFSMLGIVMYGNRTIAKARDLKERSKSFYEIYCIQIISSSFVMIAYAIFLYARNDKILIGWIFEILLIAYLFDISWFFFGIEEFKVTVTRNLIIKVASIILIFITVRSKEDVYIYAFITCFLTLVANLFLYSNLKGKICKIEYKELNLKIHIKNIFIFFIPIITISIYNILDKVMLGALSDINEVGFYECSEKVKNLPMAFVTAVGTVMLPRISNLFENGKNQEGRKYLEYSLNISMLVVSPICFGMMGIADVFVPLYYGNGFERCSEIYQFLLLSCIFLCFAQNIKTQYLIPENKERIFIFSTFYGAIVNVVLNLMLIPQYGAVGAAAGTLGAEIVVWAYQCIKAKKDIPIIRYVNNVIPFIISGILMFIIVKNMNNLCKDIIIDILFKVFIGFLVYNIVLIGIFWLKYFRRR